jgi:hypothetical protein
MVKTAQLGAHYMVRFTTAGAAPGRSVSMRGLAVTVIALAMVAGFIVRYRTGDYSMWRDELASMAFASEPYSRLWSSWMARETNPPLFYSMLRLWLELGARSVIAIRILPMIGGVAAIGLIGSLCGRISGAWAAAAGALMAALSAEHIWYSQTIRGYIFETDGVLVSMLGLVVWLSGGRYARAGLVAYVLGAAFGFYCHVTLAIWPAAAGLAIAMLHWRSLLAERAMKAIEFAIANLALAAVCAWWLWIAAHQLSSDNIEHIPRLGLVKHLNLVWHNTILIMDYPPHTQVLRFVLTLMIGVGAALLIRDKAGRTLVLSWALAIVLFHAAQVIHPIATPWAVFWLTNYSILALATLLAAVPGHWMRGALIITFAGMLGWNLAEKLPSFWWEDWRGVMATLRSDRQAILLVEQQQIGMHANWACKVEMQADRCPLPIAVMDSKDKTYAWAREFMARPLLRRPQLDSVLLRYQRVYIVNWGGPDPLVTLGLIAPHPCCVGFVRGPFSPKALLSRNYPAKGN